MHQHQMYFVLFFPHFNQILVYIVNHYQYILRKTVFKVESMIITHLFERMFDHESAKADESVRIAVEE